MVKWLQSSSARPCLLKRVAVTPSPSPLIKWNPRSLSWSKALSNWLCRKKNLLVYLDVLARDSLVSFRSASNTSWQRETLPQTKILCIFLKGHCSACCALRPSFTAKFARTWSEICPLVAFHILSLRVIAAWLWIKRFRSLIWKNSASCINESISLKLSCSVRLLARRKSRTWAKISPSRSIKYLPFASFAMGICPVNIFSMRLFGSLVSVLTVVLYNFPPTFSSTCSGNSFLGKTAGPVSRSCTPLGSSALSDWSLWLSIVNFAFDSVTIIKVCEYKSLLCSRRREVYFDVFSSDFP